MQKILRDPMSDVFGVELKMATHTKVTVSDEIEGCWTLPKSKSVCRACGTILKKVPRKGHANSEFWVNERPDGMVLKACPEGCLEKDASEIMKHFLEDRDMLKGESYNYEYDYTKFQYGWITPDCRFLFCDYMGHRWAVMDDDDDIDGYGDAERKGYIKFTSAHDGIEFSWGKKPSKRQVKIIVDCFTDRNNSIDKCDQWHLSQKNGSVRTYEKAKGGA